MSGAGLWAGVAAASGAGALLRAWVDGLVRRRARAPFGTFAVNASGALVLGLLIGGAADGGLATVLVTGLIGSYTTFSGWMLDTLRLAERGRPWAAAANVGAQLAVGSAAVVVGSWAAASL
ncbi:MAG: fluoride exporter [Miltoncostaeaceae bacterium]|nr:fluoride exporter [Miltoncostaeaceae bacterium]